MKKSILTFFLPGIAFLFFSCGNNKMNQEDDSKAMAEEQNEQKFEQSSLGEDATFVVEAADAGLLEVQLGELAQTKATSEQVKQFGEMMVVDHTKANNELKVLAQQKGITVPTSLSNKSQEKYNELAEKSGTEFNKAYIDMMVKDHKKVIDEFKDEAENGNDSNIKTWAAGKVPALQHHLERAQNIQDALEDSNNAKRSNRENERG